MGGRDGRRPRSRGRRLESGMVGKGVNLCNLVNAYMILGKRFEMNKNERNQY